MHAPCNTEWIPFQMKIRNKVQLDYRIILTVSNGISAIVFLSEE
jgi:hypothetical protein